MLGTLLRQFTLILLLIVGFQAAVHAEYTIASLDAQLTEQESQFNDLVPGTERHVRWYNGIQKTNLSIIYLHGFSASRQELSPVTENLADRLQANIYYARLSGHGRSDDAMAEASVEKWLQDTNEAYQIGQLIGDKVIVISTSTGGTLATWLVSQSTQGILANIMISPNFGVHSKLAGILRWPWGITLAKWKDGDYRSFEPISDLHAQIWTERYPTEALQPVFKLVHQVAQLDKSQVSIPQLVVYSPQDKVIDPQRILEVVPEFSKSDISLLPFTQSTDPYQHVLAGDACSPQTTDLMVGLIGDYINTLIN